MIKQYLIEPPILTSPETDETLYLYIVVSDVSVRATLFKEDEHRKQRPIFFISKSLSEAITQYTRLEQEVLVLRVASKTLYPYFQAHPIIVLTNLSLRSTINKPDLSRRMAWWAIELSEFSIQYTPHLAMKGQVLVDNLGKVPQQEMKPDNFDWWIQNVDGASRQMGAGLGLQLRAPTGEVIEHAIRLDFPTFNNEAEYKAIIAGLYLIISISSEKIIIRSDSQLVVG